MCCGLALATFHYVPRKSSQGFPEERTGKQVPGVPYLAGTQLLTHNREEVPACERGYSASMVLEVGH